MTAQKTCETCRYCSEKQEVTTIIKIEGKEDEHTKVCYEAKCTRRKIPNEHINYDDKSCPLYRKDEYTGGCDGCEWARAFENDHGYTSYDCLICDVFVSLGKCDFFSKREAPSRDCDNCKWYLDGGITDGTCRLWDRLLYYDQHGCKMFEGDREWTGQALEANDGI